jgi:hypothetical protein
MTTTISGTSGITFPNASTSTVGGVGDGQTWQNLTASRSAGTTYTNSTGKPIQIIFVLYYGADSTQRTATFTISSVTVATFQCQSNITGQFNMPTSLIVPSGGTYLLTSAVMSILNWAELR